MKKVFFVLVVSFFAGILYFRTHPITFSVIQQPVDYSNWVSVSNGYSKRIYTSSREEAEVKVIVYKMPVDKVDVELHESIPPKSFLEWDESIDSDIFINAGYFLEDYSSTGGLYIEGESKTEKQLDLDRSGLIYIQDRKISLIDTTGMDSLNVFQSPTTSYLQTYPFLIKNGKPSIEEDSGLLARRTVVGTTKNDDFLVIIVDQTPVSLFELMEILYNETDLDIDMALNLDGGPSTGFVAHFNDYDDAYYPLSSIPQILTISQPLQD